MFCSVARMQRTVRRKFASVVVLPASAPASPVFSNVMEEAPESIRGAEAALTSVAGAESLGGEAAPTVVVDASLAPAPLARRPRVSRAGARGWVVAPA